MFTRGLKVLVGNEDLYPSFATWWDDLHGGWRCSVNLGPIYHGIEGDCYPTALEAQESIACDFLYRLGRMEHKVGVEFKNVGWSVSRFLRCPDVAVYDFLVHRDIPWMLSEMQKYNFSMLNRKKHVSQFGVVVVIPSSLVVGHDIPCVKARNVVIISMERGGVSPTTFCSYSGVVIFIHRRHIVNLKGLSEAWQVPLISFDPYLD